MGTVSIKRIYDPAEDSDGYRILVDRLWPRGVSKERADLDAWLKDVAPSPDLRTWWDHDPEHMGEFAAKYRAELEDSSAVNELRDAIAEHSPVTLLYGAHDPKVNHAAILRDFLER